LIIETFPYLAVTVVEDRVVFGAWQDLFGGLVSHKELAIIIMFWKIEMGCLNELD